MVRTFIRQPRQIKEAREPLATKVSFIVPVMIVLDSIPSNKVLHRYLFPEDAVVISFSIYFEGLNGKLEVTADLRFKEGGEYSKFPVKEGDNKLLEAKDIPEGTRVELSVPDYDKATHGNPEVWISYLYRITK